MVIKLYKTLSSKKEEFKPIKDGQVGLYSCGPTVYDFVHIGNLRAYIFSDILRKTFEYNDYKVKHVMNITDVGHLVSDSDEGEDKMTKALKREGKPLTMEAMKEVADFYTEKFKEDIAELNIKIPNEMPKASENIDEDIEIIKILEEKGIAYKISDGVYFDISKFKDYGKLGDIKYGDEGQSRIETNSEKKNVRDFALWKFTRMPEAGGFTIGWDSPWGKGFPGWHIECSAMSTKYLSQPFDVHTGGIDHIPVHHQNEIAQSESAYDKPLANYWMHSEFLVIDQQKMAKSEGNFITLNILKEKSFNPLVYRFFVLGAHYRSPINFSWTAMETAKNGLNNLCLRVGSLGKKVGKVNEEYKNKFLEKINDDLNTPQALAIAQELLKSNLSDEDKLATVLDFDKVLGLKLEKELEPVKVPDEVQELDKKRSQARKDKNWEEADSLKKQIEKLGFDIEDTKADSILTKT